MSERFVTTGIGSMPHRDPESACKIILNSFDIPFWPQLPKLGHREYMIHQFSENFPGVVFEGDKVYVKKDYDLASEWLSNYSDETETPISKDHALGLYTLGELLKDKKLPVIKGQITGPVTYTLSLKDEEGIPIYFDETLRELALLFLKSKALWQIKFLRELAEEVWLFMDEPVLQAIGTSAYISVEQAEVKRLIDELSVFVKNLGVKIGLHCCGRADWREILNSEIEILSFDSFFFFDFFKIYKGEIEDFLKRGGLIAWGFVPTTDDIKELTDRKIISQAKEKIDEIGGQIPLIFENSILTPSCGMGSLDEEDSLRVCSILGEIKRILNG